MSLWTALLPHILYMQSLQGTKELRVLLQSVQTETFPLFHPFHKPFNLLQWLLPNTSKYTSNECHKIHFCLFCVLCLLSQVLIRTVYNFKLHFNKNKNRFSFRIGGEAWLPAFKCCRKLFNISRELIIS